MRGVDVSDKNQRIKEADRTDTVSEDKEAMLSIFAGYLDGPGNVDGSGSVVRFNKPHGIAFDTYGNIFVADTENNTIRKITPAGFVSTYAGMAGVCGYMDGERTSARFCKPVGIAIDSENNIYISDTENRLIRKISQKGYVSTIAGVTRDDPRFDDDSIPHLAEPRDLVLDKSGVIFVLDRSAIRKITHKGSVSTLAGSVYEEGYKDGKGGIARFSFLSGLAIDALGDLYVSDSYNAVIRKITQAGMVSTVAGKAGEEVERDGVGLEVRFLHPTSISIDKANNIYVVDGPSYEGDPIPTTIRKIMSTGNVTTLNVDLIEQISSEDGDKKIPSTLIAGIAIDSAGNIYTTDAKNGVIRKNTNSGKLITIYGSRPSKSNPDYSYGGEDAHVHRPEAVTVDHAGNVYVANDSFIKVVKITPSRDIYIIGATAANHVMTVVDNEYNAIRTPKGIAVDADGNVYLSDIFPRNLSTDVGIGPGVFFNSFFKKKKFDTIRRLSASGSVSTLLDKSANLKLPGGIAVDKENNIYIADSANDVIRKVTKRSFFGWGITTLTGKEGERGNTDDVGVKARFNHPKGVAIDNAGNIYVADTENHLIRKISADGAVRTIAGKAGQPGSKNGKGTNARFNKPTSVAVDDDGNVYVVDLGNNLVRKITPEGMVSTLAGKLGQIGFAPGVLPGVIAKPTGLAVYNSSLYITMRDGVAVIHNLSRSSK